MARPGRGQHPLSRRYGGPGGTPLPRAPSPTPGNPKTQQSIHTPGVPGPPFPVPPADGLPFFGACNCLAHDICKIRRHGDDPAGCTVPRLVEGCDGGSPAGHCRPRQRGPHIRHSGTATGYQDKPHHPTTPSPTPNPNPPVSAALPAASAIPTARPHEASSDANRAVGNRTTEPPPSLQCQHGGTVPGDLKDNRATKERPDKSRDGGSLLVHSRRPVLPSAAHPPRRCVYGDVTCLSHQGPRRGGGRPQHFLIPRPLSLGRVGGGASNAQVGRNFGGRSLDLLHRHESADELFQPQMGQFT